MLLCPGLLKITCAPLPDRSAHPSRRSRFMTSRGVTARSCGCLLGPVEVPDAPHLTIDQIAVAVSRLQYIAEFSQEALSRTIRPFVVHQDRQDDAVLPKGLAADRAEDLANGSAIRRAGVGKANLIHQRLVAGCRTSGGYSLQLRSNDGDLIGPCPIPVDEAVGTDETGPADPDLIELPKTQHAIDGGASDAVRRGGQCEGDDRQSGIVA
jgi:hypothetical protein